MKNRFSLLILVLVCGIFAGAQSKTAEQLLPGFGDFLFSHQDETLYSADGRELQQHRPQLASQMPSALSWFSEVMGLASHETELIQRELWGQKPRSISGLGREFTQYSGETYEGETQFATDDITIQESDWRKTHESYPATFTDASFPANLKSLRGEGHVGGDTSAKDKAELEKMKDFTFKRVGEIEPQFQVIKDIIRPEEVSQGGLGDCYLLGALASIAKTPHRLERNLLQRVKSPKGAYAISLCITGIWTPVYIDDLFPVKEDGKTIAFTNIKDKVIWPILFEKAYAKQYGAYWHIGDGGVTDEALRDITGAPSQYFKLSDPEVDRTAIEMLLEADKQNFFMTAQSKGQGEVKSSNGIITGHAYSLMSVINLSSGLRLVKLRNPWSNGEWNGAWSDKSDLWTDNYKKEAGWIDKDDGIFFMTYPDFKQNFESVSIGYYHDNYVYSALPTTNGKGNTDSMQFTVSQPGEYYVGASQPSKFEFGNNPKHEYGYINVIILQRLPNGEFKYIDGFAKKNRDLWTKVRLDKGDYLALVFTNWASTSTKYTLWTYGVKNTVIKKVRSGLDVHQALAKAFTSHALATANDWKGLFTDPETKKALARTKEVDLAGYRYKIYQNTAATDRTLQVQAEIQLTNAQIVYPQRGGDKLQLSVPRGESRIHIVRTEDLPNQYKSSESYAL